ncbi:uncharacterized protein B0P05DRAFT_470638 [Gilbertella persicaria]|uniref:uncharacterized protein n=1 Tax=Gilbertella persicaria TaxID=101096 RepID=UPI00222115F8|nr:uncharacterized protein B0P05DRAFT_470638 [Gilbertella persicaria]KAI8078253.1 hypothetical protein B0P05DRAFT_470638 [Gilbertella persicaria]
MCDTNWCTFCDCAVSPNLDSIYCSEECFRKDAHDEQTSMMSPLSSQQDTTSICSDDLAAMHVDMLPSSPTEPMLSFTNSHSADHSLVSTPQHSSINEKLSPFQL